MSVGEGDQKESLVGAQIRWAVIEAIIELIVDSTS